MVEKARVQLRAQLADREAVAAAMLANGLDPAEWAIAIDAQTGATVGPVRIVREQSEDAAELLGAEMGKLALMAIAYVNGHTLESGGGGSWNQGPVGYGELKAQANYVESLREGFSDGEGRARFVGED